MEDIGLRVLTANVRYDRMEFKETQGSQLLPSTATVEAETVRRRIAQAAGRIHSAFKKQFRCTDCRTLCGLDLTTEEGRAVLLERLCAALAAQGARTLVVDASENAPAPDELAVMGLAECIEPLSAEMSYLAARGLPAPDVVVETSDLAVLRGVLSNSDLLTAISAVRLRTSSAGFSSITSSEASAPVSAIISMQSCASR